MSDQVWRDRISALRSELQETIASKEAAFEHTIPDYLSLNNVKTKLARLEAIERNLALDKYTLVFIGTIGEGKTTAICHLFNLTGEFDTSRSIGGKSKKVRETQELLATGSGRTTMCEVVVRASDRTYLEIEPYSAHEMESMILDFCDSLADPAEVLGEVRVALPKEIETAIRNVIQLTKVSVTNSDGDRPSVSRIDRAKEEMDKSGLSGLKTTALHNAKLAARTQTKVAYDGRGDEREWIKRTFARINTAEDPTVAIPRKIHLRVSESLVSNSGLSGFEAVVDTKGIDENPLRRDLDEYITREDTICLFATGFKDAPETNIRELMKFYLSSKSRDFHHRFVTLVLPHKSEPEKTNGSDGTWEGGTTVRREDVQSAFRNLGLEFFPENVVFYDALRYFRSEPSVLDESLYSDDDVEGDRLACLNSVSQLVERRRQHLLREIDAIEAGFEKIKGGEALTDKEIQALEAAVLKIEGVQDLGKRVPSFVYDEFIDTYVLHYRNKYRAWNTKDAIHRRFGVYGNHDLYYDARVIAQGKDDDDMLRKFTKEPKVELEAILLGLTESNPALEDFILDLIRKFEASFDDFISKVGEDMEGVLDKKLSPRSPESDFWQALISEKGKQRAKGETYTENVCQTFRRELQSGDNLNDCLEDKAKSHWADLVSGVLGYFGK